MDLTRPVAPDPYSVLPAVPDFTVTSADIADGQTIAAPFTGAQDVSPHLAWTGFPASTASFVVTCFDPDAPGPEGFWHWAVANLPPSTTWLPQGAGASHGAALPAGAVQGRNDSGMTGYTGPYPPRGDRVHRYVFAVHALDVARLDVEVWTEAAAVAAKALPHTIARAVITPVFQR